ncbi:MAG: DUF2190 family protein [Lysobacter sp.]
MAKNFKREGETIDFTAAADTASGELVLVGGVAAVALNDVASGQVGVGRTQGVWELPAVSSGAVTQGALAYVTAGGNVSGSSSGNTLIGRYWEAKADGVAVALIKINVP